MADCMKPGPRVQSTPLTSAVNTKVINNLSEGNCAVTCLSPNAQACLKLAPQKMNLKTSDMCSFHIRNAARSIDFINLCKFNQYRHDVILNGDKITKQRTLSSKKRKTVSPSNTMHSIICNVERLTETKRWMVLCDCFRL